MRSLVFVIIPLFAIGLLTSSVLELRAYLIGKEAVERMQAFQQDLRVASGSRSELRTRRADGSTPGAGRVDRSFARASDYQSNPSGSVSGLESTEEGPRALELEGRETLDLARRASSSLFGSTSTLSSYASLLRVLAEGQSLTREKLAFYCDSLAMLGEILQREPRNARALMQWGNLRQILGSLACEKPLTEGDFKEALTSALELDPTDADAQYAAGLILRWGRAVPEAAKLFYRVFRYHPRLSGAQERQILGSIDSPQMLREVVPARFPQVLRASHYFLREPYLVRTVNVADEQFLQALAELQSEALALSQSEYGRGLLPFSMHLQRMTELADTAASPQVRQELDRQLAILLRRRGDTALAQYLSERATWKLLEVVPTTIGGDTRPLKTPLVRWGETNSFFADEFYRSIGFFLPDGQGVRSIELNFSGRPSGAYRSALHVYVSSDNQNWTEISTGGEEVPFSLGSKNLVVIRTPVRGDLYWKVHFANAARDRRLLATIASNLKVFGVSARHAQSSGATLGATAPGENGEAQ